VKALWLAFAEEEPRGAFARATVREGGWLAAWEYERRPPGDAWLVDPRAIDPDGPRTTVALVAAPPGVSLHFDDPSVTGAIRAALASEPAEVCSCLMKEGSRFVGALVSPPHLATPFATIFPQRTITVGRGLLGRPPWPTGPGTARYVAEVPWPFDRFA
jgi:hypothetical protein